MSSMTVFLSGITCEACQKMIQRRVGKIQGVQSVTVDLQTGQTTIDSDREISTKSIVTALAGTPYAIQAE